VICTGSRTALPELAGLDEARPWTNRQATDASTVPGRLAIVGGGGVGVEMASAWQGLGSAVTLLAQADGLLSRMEAFAGELVGRGLAEAGVDVRIGVTVTGIRRPVGTGPVTLTLEGGSELEADEVLFATGRQPLTDDIGLDTVGLVSGSWLEVDDTCMVTALEDGWLYALGDVNRHALLTHQGKYQARIAGAAIAARAAGQPVDPAPWGPHAVTADYYAVPQVFFCDPPAGAVGLTADQAERAGHRIRVVDVDLGQAVPGAGLYADGYTGRARMVVDEDHGRLLGVTFVGPGVEELIHSALGGDRLGGWPGRWPGRAGAAHLAALLPGQRAGPGAQQLAGEQVEEHQGVLLDADADQPTGEDLRGRHVASGQLHCAVAGHDPVDLDGLGGGMASWTDPSRTSKRDRRRLAGHPDRSESSMACPPRFAALHP